MSSPSTDLHEELAYWRTLAEDRGRVIQALHEFNYWHASTVARGEVIVGLERSVELWRERCLAAEANPAVFVEAEVPRATEPRLTPKRFVLKAAFRVLHPLEDGVVRRLEAG